MSTLYYYEPAHYRYSEVNKCRFFLQTLINRYRPVRISKNSAKYVIFVIPQNPLIIDPNSGNSTACAKHGRSFQIACDPH